MRKGIFNRWHLHTFSISQQVVRRPGGFRLWVSFHVRHHCVECTRRCLSSRLFVCIPCVYLRSLHRYQTSRFPFSFGSGTISSSWSLYCKNHLHDLYHFQATFQPRLVLRENLTGILVLSLCNPIRLAYYTMPAGWLIPESYWHWRALFMHGVPAAIDRQPPHHGPTRGFAFRSECLYVPSFARPPPFSSLINILGYCKLLF